MQGMTFQSFITVLLPTLTTLQARYEYFTLMSFSSGIWYRGSLLKTFRNIRDESAAINMKLGIVHVLSAMFFFHVCVKKGGILDEFLKAHDIISF